MIAEGMQGDDVPQVSMATAKAIVLPDIRLYLKNTPGKGRGVYADEDIPYNTLINISPLLLFPSHGPGSGDHSSGSDEGSAERRVLRHYTYTFDSDHQALALGLGSMFNHAKHNNVGFIVDKQNLLIKYSSVTAIRKGSELCINYGNHLWFDDSESGDASSSSEGEDPFSRMEL